MSVIFGLKKYPYFGTEWKDDSVLECILFLQRTRIQFPALTWWSTTIFSSIFRGSVVLFWLLWAPGI